MSLVVGYMQVPEGVDANALIKNAMVRHPTPALAIKSSRARSFKICETQQLPF